MAMDEAGASVDEDSSCLLLLLIVVVFPLLEVGASEGEDSSCEDSKSGTENGVAKKTRNSGTSERHGHQPVIGKREPSAYAIE